jgi:pimeloyl-ACP methyl ester carboxylesterase
VPAHILAAAGLFAMPPSFAAEVHARGVSFESAGYRLIGTLTTPVGRSPTAGVLIIGGSGPVDRDGASRLAPSAPHVYREWAERLSEHGFAVLRYDKRFLTHPNIDIAALDQEAQIADAVAAVAFLQKTDGDRRVFIIGHSEGGTLGPIVAERTKAVAGVVIVNAVHFPVDELLVAQLEAQPNVKRAEVENVKRLMADIKAARFREGATVLGAGAKYWAQWIAFTRDSPQTLARSSVRVLLVQSLKDENFPGESLTRNVAILRRIAAMNANVQVRELADHGHLGVVAGSREASAELLRVFVSWLESAR